jgi:hypothetical protein
LEWVSVAGLNEDRRVTRAQFVVNLKIEAVRGRKTVTDKQWREKVKLKVVSEETEGVRVTVKTSLHMYSYSSRALQQMGLMGAEPSSFKFIKHDF